MSGQERLTHYQLLGLHPGATEEEIRRAFRRMRLLFDADSPALYGLYRPTDAQREMARLAAAYQTLLDPVARRRYDRGVLPREPGRRAADASSARRSQAPRSRRPDNPLEAAGIGPEERLDGAAIAKVRAVCEIRLEEIAERTKISMFTLRSIEGDQYDDLPPVVYLRGFLKQIATHLGVPGDRLLRDYVACVNDWSAARQKPHWSR